VQRRIILVVVAILISAVTFLLIQGWVHGSAGHRAPGAGGRPAAPVVHVLVAKADIPEGGVLTADSVRWQVWPSDGPIGPYLVQGRWRVEDVVGAVTRSNLNAGEPLTAPGLARPGDRGALAATLTPGYRAITVNVTPSTGMAGFLVPGDHVDLILTLTMHAHDKDNSAHHVSETVLRDIRVVGLDQTLSPDPKTDKKGEKKDAEPPKTATVEVTPKQAEIVEVAADLGVLSLSLRSLGRADGDGPPDAPTHTWDSEAAQGLLGGPPTADRPRGTRSSPAAHVFVVRGDKITEMTMNSRALKASVTP
jgi:pilus assembly protein CpaB